MSPRGGRAPTRRRSSRRPGIGRKACGAREGAEARARRRGGAAEEAAGAAGRERGRGRAAEAPWSGSSPAAAWVGGQAGEVGRAKQISCFARWAYTTQLVARNFAGPAKQGRRDKYWAFNRPSVGQFGEQKSFSERAHKYQRRRKKRKKIVPPVPCCSENLQSSCKPCGDFFFFFDKRPRGRCVCRNRKLEKDSLAVGPAVWQGNSMR